MQVDSLCAYDQCAALLHVWMDSSLQFWNLHAFFSILLVQHEPCLKGGCLMVCLLTTLCVVLRQYSATSLVESFEFLHKQLSIVTRVAKSHYLRNWRHLPPCRCERQHTMKQGEVECGDKKSHNWQVQLKAYLHLGSSLLYSLWISHKLLRMQSVFWHCTSTSSLLT